MSLVTNQLKRHRDFVFTVHKPGHFQLVHSGTTADLYVHRTDYLGVLRAVEDLREDIHRVTNLLPAVKNESEKLSQHTVIVGTIGKSPIIDQLVQAGRLDVSGIKDQWEAYVIQSVSHPLPGVTKGLVIAGSDKRGTIYGIYELSRQIGISPWYWWADVTPQKHDCLTVKNGIYKQGSPSVQYRGIFLNNEAPSLTTWVNNKFGGFNHHFYEKIFELVLRLRANLLWPAMWSPKSFFRDDPLNPKLAHEYGVVIGTSHHEPMMRSWGEWGRFGKGEWNYSTNASNLLDFWDEGVQWVKDYEKLITVGMRGDGDEPMMEEGPIEERIKIMENIIRDQRKIISKRINPNVTQVEQVLALYKEVQEFYEQGMDVPEDVIILLANDNFGNIRMLPQKDERKHPSGYGMYYHFDYVGGPFSYRWVTSTPYEKIWEQLNMTYEHGVHKIWIVNVGDLKPHEAAAEFFLEMAYDISKWHRTNLPEFSLQWAEREFGRAYAAPTAEIVRKYKKCNGRRKGEILKPDTYSLTNYKEAETVLAQFEEMALQAEHIYHKLPSDKKDAFFQLVLYPTRASKNVMRVNIYAGLNNLYSKQGRIIANLYADLTEKAFEELNQDTVYYNQTLADGKWNGIMSNAHIGQTEWRSPERNIMPDIQRLPVMNGSEMGIAVEGSEDVWLENGTVRDLPAFSALSREPHFIDIFNLKGDPFKVTLSPSEPWIVLQKRETIIHQQQRIWVNIDWGKVPEGEEVTGELTIGDGHKKIAVEIRVYNPSQSFLYELEDMTFVESNGYVSMEGEHYSDNVAVGNAAWQRIPDYGRTLSSMAIFPTTTPTAVPGENAPYLEYKVYISNPGEVTVTTYKAPSNNIYRDRGLRYAIAFNDQEPQIIDSFPKENDAFYTSPLWSIGVIDNIRKNESQHLIHKPGVHTLRFWMVDPGIVLQKIVIDTGGVKPSYLGPPESYFKGKTKAVGKEGYLELLTWYDYARYLAESISSGDWEGLTVQESLGELNRAVLSAQEILSDPSVSLQKRVEMVAVLEESIKSVQRGD